MRRVLVAIAVALSIVSHATAARDRLAEVAVELVAEGFSAPVFLVAPTDGSTRRFVGEQAGQVFILTEDGERLETPFLNLSEQVVPLLQAFDERGLLGLAFHPDFAENGLFYVNYSAKPRPESPFHGETAYTRRLSEFRVSAADPNRADPATERVLLEVDWANRKHNGGGLAFGPDGYLYLGLGDGGGVHGVPDIYIPPPSDSDDPYRHAEEIPEDPFRIPERFHEYDRHAQDTSLLYGKILRIDVDHGHPGYAIPPSG